MPAPYSETSAWNNASVVQVVEALAACRLLDLVVAVKLTEEMCAKEGRPFCLTVDTSGLLMDAKLIPIPLDEFVKVIGDPKRPDPRTAEAQRRLLEPIAPDHTRFVCVGTRACWADIPVYEGPPKEHN
jgi:hypothetical protein